MGSVRIGQWRAVARSLSGEGNVSKSGRSTCHQRYKHFATQSRRECLLAAQKRVVAVLELLVGQPVAGIDHLHAELARQFGGVSDQRRERVRSGTRRERSSIPASGSSRLPFHLRDRRATDREARSAPGSIVKLRQNRRIACRYARVLRHRSASGIDGRIRVPSPPSTSMVASGSSSPPGVTHDGAIARKKPVRFL